MPLDEGVELPPETGETFAENALIKARAARERSGEPGDRRRLRDRGGGARGASRACARRASPATGASDEQNLALLMRELESVDDRRVAYVCVIALVDADGAEHLFEGRCEGTLAREPRGSGGFGYDPAFVPDDTGPEDSRTMAELSPAEKHAISHRGRAARALARHLSGRREAERR